MDPQEVYRRTFSADVFLTSANAITEEGEPVSYTHLDVYKRQAHVF